MAYIMNYAEYIPLLVCNLLSIFSFLQTFRFRSKVTARLHQIRLIFQRIFNMQANTFHFTIVKKIVFFQRG